MLKSIKAKNREEFEKKVMCYCEEGKESDHTTSNPEIILSFLSFAEDNILRGVIEMIEGMKKKCDGEFGCGYDGLQKDNQAICGGPFPSIHPIIRYHNQALEDLKEKLLKELEK